MVIDKLRLVLFFSLSGFFWVYITGCTLHRHNININTIRAAEYNFATCDYAKAFDLLWDPVKHNDPIALYAMGYLYFYGLGIDENKDLGRNLIERAAQQRYRRAIAALKLIRQHQFVQYVPFEDFRLNTENEGIMEVALARRPVDRLPTHSLG